MGSLDSVVEMVDARFAVDRSWLNISRSMKPLSQFVINDVSWRKEDDSDVDVIVVGKANVEWLYLAVSKAESEA